MIQQEEKRYEAALELARRKHEGQFRIGGDPYITHPVSVAQIVRDWGYGIDHQIAALFHDLMEDTDVTAEELLTIGGADVLRAVELVTKEQGYIMADYIARIRNHPIAKVVKAADRLHNLRCALVAGEDFKRKYILESLDWYLDFSPEIPVAVKQLAQSMETPLAELSFLYEPVDSWRIQ